MVLALFIILVAAPWAGAAHADKEVLLLRSLMIERLALMEQVAAYKWNNGRPIDDPAREANVLKAALARSRAAGLEPDVARRFVVAQMEAAKIVQRFYFDRWAAAGVGRVPDVPDLVTELRPRIGALSAALIAARAEARGELETCAAAAVLSPVPKAFSHVPRAWAVAVDGVAGKRPECR